jgi:hypothetical protein
MPKAPPVRDTTSKQRTRALADAVDMVATAHRHLESISLRTLGNADPLKDTIRQCREEADTLRRRLLTAIEQDAEHLRRQ